jgi:hypothetical protein
MPDFDFVEPPSYAWAVCPHLYPSKICSEGQLLEPALFGSRSEAEDFKNISGLDWLNPVQILPLAPLTEHSSGQNFGGPWVRDFEGLSGGQDRTRHADLKRAIIEDTVKQPGSGSALPGIECFLFKNWEFSQIEGHAWQRPAHVSVVTDPAWDRLRAAVFDLEKALLARHAQLSLTDVFNFWTSWDVWRHLADFGRKRLCGKTAPLTFAPAWLTLQRQVGSYALSLLNTPEPEEPIGPGVRDLRTLTVVIVNPIVSEPTHEDAENVMPVASEVPKKSRVSPVHLKKQPQHWEEIEVHVLSPDRVQIRVGDATEPPRNYQEMGFGDQKSGKAKRAWTVLLSLSQVGNFFSLEKISPMERPQIERRIQEIRKIFRELFAIEGDPIPFVPKSKTEPERGYRTRFRITHVEGFAAYAVGDEKA